MGIEGKHGYAGAHDAEIAAQRRVESLDLLLHRLLGDSLRHASHRGVGGQQSHAQRRSLGAHHHQRLLARLAERRLQILRMAGEPERVALHLVLVDRRGDEHVDIAGLEIGHGALESRHGGLAGRARCLSRFNLGVFSDHVDYVVVLVAGLRRLLHLVERQRRQFERLAVESCYLGRSVDHRSAQFEDRLVLQSLHDHLVADTVDIALRDAYLEFFVVSHLSL